MIHTFGAAMVALAASAVAATAQTSTSTNPPPIHVATPTGQSAASSGHVTASEPTVPKPVPVAMSKIALVRIVDRLREGEVWATARGGWFCAGGTKSTWTAGSQDDKPSFYQSAFRDAMTQAGISVAGDPDNLFDRQTDMGDLEVAAVITDVNLD